MTDTRDHIGSASAPPGNDGRPGEYHEISARLEAVNRRRAFYSLWTGLMNGAAACVVIALAAMLIELILLPGTTGRSAIFITAVALSVGTLIALTGGPLLELARLRKSAGVLAAARMVGDSMPEVRDRLEDAIELVQQRESLAGNYSVNLIDEAFTTVADDLRAADFRSVVSEQPVRRAAFRAYAILGACLLIFLLAG
jgi:hypothetical protein